jgi:CRISPR/Cas system endoribonuclease Cas6 (RAMP superfamily)
VDINLPSPDQVWRSLWQRWNAFAPPELHIDPFWPEFAAHCIVVSDFLLRSTKVTFKQGEKGAATGCTGQATYRLLPEKHCGEYALFRPGSVQVLRTLAGFAIFSGIGHHTTIGLGQSRWVNDRSADKDEI